MVSKLKALIVYLSYSGNTKEVAEIIEATLTELDVTVDTYEIGCTLASPIQPDRYDVIFLGTFTWAKGAVPEEMKDFVFQIGYKPKNIAIFGTGDTQFGGDELFCLAADKLAKFYRSRWSVLKIEQSPRGSQANKVKKWTEEVVKDAAIII